MSSYRSNYVQWTRGGSGIGSSYSPASSTSSLTSSTSSISGSSSNKYGSSSYKASDSRVPSRESSFISGLPSTSSSGTGRLSRFSSLSSKTDNLSSTISGSTSSNYGSSNLSASSKNNFDSSKSSSASKDKTPGLSNGYGLASVSNLSSKFSTPSETPSSSSYRTSSPSVNSYLRLPAGSGSESAATTPKAKASTPSDNSASTKQYSSGSASYNSNSKSTDPTSNTTSTGSGSGSGTGYRPYSTRGLGGSSDLSLGTSTVASALRTTARFGLRSGPSHAHYSSSPTTSTLKAAAALAEETKKELSKSEKKVDQDLGPVTWMSQGTCTSLDKEDFTAMANKELLDEEMISTDEVPSFEPRVFSSRYDGVLKHKGIQTDEEPKPKVMPSSIPRPTLSLNYYSSGYGSALGRFSSAKNSPANQQTDKNDDSTELSSTKSSNTKLNAHVGNAKEKELKEASSKTDYNSNSSSNLKGSGTFNNTSNNKTPGTMTSGSDQSSRSSQQTINTKIVVESGDTSNNEHETSTSSITTKTTTNPTNEDNNSSKVPSSTGVVITVANKEFRKSALNVGLKSKDAEEEFAKKQEELRLQKSLDSNSTQSAKSEPHTNKSNNSPDKQISNTNVSPPAVLGTTKREFPRRPPADPAKLPTPINSNQSITKATSKSPQDASVISNPDKSTPKEKPSTITSGLIKMKSSKNICQLRKLSTGSTASESESCSSLSVSSTSVKGSDITKKVKKTSLTSNNNLDNKGQGRRGSATSCSSATSSRSNSVERNTNNNNNSKSNNTIKVGSNNNTPNSSTNLTSQNKPPSGSLSSIKDIKESKKQTVAGSITKTESQSKKLIPKIEESKPPIQTVEQKKSPDTSATEPVQTSFLLRTLGNDKPWLRKCQSGELPWWLQSNPDVPGILGKNPSKCNLTRDPTSKDISIKEEQLESSPELSEESDLEMETDENATFTPQLGERTSPDGVEVPSMLISPKSTLLGHNKADSFTSNDNGSRKNSLFIGGLTNIDDILGTVSPSLVAESPSPAPTPTNPAMDELCEAQRKMSLKYESDDESSSTESSEEEEIEDDLDKAEFQKDEDVSDSEVSDEDDASTGTSSSFEEVDPCSVKISASAHTTLSPGEAVNNTDQGSQRRGSSGNKTQPVGLISKSQREKLDDATLQLYKDGECGTYLDLESSISEQHEDFEGFLDNRKNSIVLRAQLPVRVHAIIEKLLTSDGRELRRALFSLKQIFQEDKDLVHEFVENGGLSCLIKVGSEADQNYQNYILRAIGQVMLYVDGMYGVMRHNETIQWLYNLVASKFRLVQKTALKLLLVFVDYVETNCLLLVQAVTAVDHNKGLEGWSNVMNLLREQDSNSGDTELLVYAMTLVNKVLNAIPDTDTYYDQVDALEEHGMANIIQSYMGKQCADLDLLKQFQIYEVVLKHEDGEEDNIMMQLDESMRSKLLTRKGYSETDGSTKDRRKSRRHSTSTPPTTPNGSTAPSFPRRLSSADVTPKDSPFSSLSSSSSHGTLNAVIPNGHTTDKSNLELTPGLRRRRDRAEHQKNLILEQLVNGVSGESNHFGEPESPTNSSESFISSRRQSGSKKEVNSLELQNNLKNSGTNSANGNGSPNCGTTAARPWMLPIYTKSNGTANSTANIANGDIENGDSESDKSMQLKRENTVKDLTQKLASQNLLASPAEENKSFIINGELSGVVSKAKEGLAKSKSRADMKPQPCDNGVSNKGMHIEVKKSDNELHWDFLVNNLQRPLEICDLDFTDLKISDDEDILEPDPSHMNGYGLPPPVPMMNGHPPPPPPSIGKYGGAPPPPINGLGIGSPLFGVNLKAANNTGSATEAAKNTVSKKTKKTVKLFWKEVREDPITASKVKKVGCIWKEIQPPPIDTQRLGNLFESRAKDIINKKQSDANKSKEIVVLDPKRSNAINIGMTKLPPPRTIKAAIMKMDSTIINREGIEKLLAMLPTEEERAKITEAQFANPETPLGSAEQFLLTLSSISELTARLKLWAFKLDYDNLEREVAEPLMDLKTGIVDLEKNKTFRYILATLLSIGNFLNGAEAKGFQIEYLSKVPEVKDTVQKHSLLHHLCQTVNENYPESTDLYSEIGPVTRASRVDFDEIATNLAKMENDCKTSWDHLRVIAKHDGPTNLKLKLSEFLADCAERIIVLGMIHRRIMNRFSKFLLWLGVSAHQVTTTKPHTLFKIVSEFALEYRTTRERVIQQLQKKANHRERNKTRGKMITEQIVHKSKEDQEDAELRQVLNKCTTNGTDEIVKGSLTWTRRQKSQPHTPTTPTSTIYHNFQNSKISTLNSNGTLTDGDDEILESLVKTATRTSDTRMANRERKRNNGTRNFSDRKSLRRTLRHGLTEEERKMLAAFMANGHSFYS